MIKIPINDMKTLSQHEYGYLCAVIIAARMGNPKMAACMIENAGYEGLDCSQLSKFEKQWLCKVNQHLAIKLIGLGQYH